MDWKEYATDVGYSFSLGFLGGGSYTAARTFYDSPNGYRVRNAVDAFVQSGPRSGAEHALFAALNGGFEGVVRTARRRVRGKELTKYTSSADFWDHAISGGLTSAFLAARGGTRPTIQSFLLSFGMLTVSEGIMNWRSGKDEHPMNTAALQNRKSKKKKKLWFNIW